MYRILMVISGPIQLSGENCANRSKLKQDHRFLAFSLRLVFSATKGALGSSSRHYCNRPEILSWPRGVHKLSLSILTCSFLGWERWFNRVCKDKFSTSASIITVHRVIMFSKVSIGSVTGHTWLQLSTTPWYLTP